VARPRNGIVENHGKKNKETPWTKAKKSKKKKRNRFVLPLQLFSFFCFAANRLFYFHLTSDNAA